MAYRIRVCPELTTGIFIRNIDSDDETYINPTYDDLSPTILERIHINKNVNVIQARKAKSVLGSLLNKIMTPASEDDEKTEESKGADDDKEDKKEKEEEEGKSSEKTEKQAEEELNEKIPKTSLSALEQVVLTNKCKEKLIAHIFATKTVSRTITDESMMIPELDQYGRPADPIKDADVGHVEAGRSIAIHSVVVDKEYQKTGLGSIMLRDYIKRMSIHGTADRLILLAHEELVPFYERLGFINMGPSKATFGGGDWISMERELEMPEEGDDY